MQTKVSIEVDIKEQNPEEINNCECCGSEIYLKEFAYYLILDNIKLREPICYLCEGCYEENKESPDDYWK